MGLSILIGHCRLPDSGEDRTVDPYIFPEKIFLRAAKTHNFSKKFIKTVITGLK
jgi:hypothetical protein